MSMGPCENGPFAVIVDSELTVSPFARHDNTPKLVDGEVPVVPFSRPPIPMVKLVEVLSVRFKVSLRRCHMVDQIPLQLTIEAVP